MMTANEQEARIEPVLIPWDLKRWFGERTLVHLALEAVQAIPDAVLRETTRSSHDLEGELAPRTSPGDGVSPLADAGVNVRMMLTLASYCYAVGHYGSHEIATAARFDPNARYICAHRCPAWQAIRSFRRRHRRQVRQCLADLFLRAWAAKFDEGEADYGGSGWFEREVRHEVTALVDAKLDAAAMVDSVAVEG